MEKVESKKYSKEQIERAYKKYVEHLTKNCTKAVIINIVAEIHRDYFPDDLCLAHLN